MDWLHRIAEEKIQAAVEEGKLDNLAGAGKPLRIETSPFVPEDLQLAYKILKDAGFVPPELELKREILTLKDLLETVTDDDDRTELARRINERVLRLNLMLKRSFTTEDRQVYGGKVRRKLEGETSTRRREDAKT